MLAWTLRGAPHVYRRGEAAGVAAAVAPWSEADAAKRIFDAAKPLREAGIPVLDALDGSPTRCARSSPARPSRASSRRELSARLDAPYLRFCRVCDATHTYEQPFRLSLLRAGLELEPGTSPPVLRRIPGWRGPAARVPEHLDPVRAVLHLLGPATPKQVAGYVDSPVREVAARWPEDIREVEVDGEPRSMLAGDVAALTGAEEATGVRLLGPFDLFLQGRDRETVVPDEAARKDLWRTLGRPGGLLHGHERDRHLATALVGEEAAARGGGVVRCGPTGRDRRGRRAPGRLPGPGVRRLRDRARSARGSAPCPGRRRRTW